MEYRTVQNVMVFFYIMFDTVTYCTTGKLQTGTTGKL